MAGSMLRWNNPSSNSPSHSAGYRQSLLNWIINRWLNQSVHVGPVIDALSAAGAGGAVCSQAGEAGRSCQRASLAGQEHMMPKGTPSHSADPPPLIA